MTGIEKARCAAVFQRCLRQLRCLLFLLIEKDAAARTSRLDGDTV